MGIFDSFNQRVTGLGLPGGLGLLQAGTDILGGKQIGDAVRGGLQTFQGVTQMDEERKRKALVQKLISEGGFTPQEQALIAATPSQNQASVAAQIRAQKAAASKPNIFQQRKTIGEQQNLEGNNLQSFILTGELPKEPKLSPFEEKKAALKDAGISLNSEAGKEALFGIKPKQISAFAEKEAAVLKVYKRNSPEYLEALFNIKDTPPSVFQQKVAQLKENNVEEGSDTWNQALYGIAPNFGTTFRRDFNFIKEQKPDASVDEIIAILNKDTTFNLGRNFERQGDYIVTEDPDSPGGVKFSVIPGSPTDLRQQSAKEKTEKILSSNQTRTESEATSGTLVLEEIDRAIAAIKANPLLTTGLGAQVTQNIAGTPAADLSQLLAPIQANIGFDRLQRMRNESPTGGALGQVAVKELDFLQATQGSLSQLQNSPQLLENLERLGEQYKASMLRIYRAALKDQQDGVINTVTNEIIDPLDYFSQSEIDMLTSSEAQPEGSFAERLSKATTVSELNDLATTPNLSPTDRDKIMKKLEELF